MSLKADYVIIHANELLTMKGFSNRPKTRGELEDLGIIKDGAVAIKDDRIIAVGSTKDVLDRVEKGFNIIDASGMTVSPGFIDPHVHLIFAGTREDELEMMIKGYSYLEVKKRGGGMNRTVMLTREASTEYLIKKTIKILDNMLIHGTTTIEAKSGYEMSFEGEKRQLEIIRTLNKIHPIDLFPTFCAQAIPPEWEGKVNEFAKEIADRWIPNFIKLNLIKYCDVFAEVGFFNTSQTRIILESCKKLGKKIRIHADWLANSGGGELGVELGVVSADHLIHTPLNIIDKIAAKGIIGVFLPTTPFCYLGKYANAREIINRGVPVAIGTDLSAADMCESMQMMMTIASLQMKMTPAEVFSAATINAAHAIEMANEIGSIEEGKKADIIILDIPNHKFISYHYGINHVKIVFKNGRLVVEDGKIVNE